MVRVIYGVYDILKICKFMWISNCLICV